MGDCATEEESSLRDDIAVVKDTSRRLLAGDTLLAAFSANSGQIDLTSARQIEPVPGAFLCEVFAEHLRAEEKVRVILLVGSSTCPFRVSSLCPSNELAGRA